jgi:hypothetical protein
MKKNAYLDKKFPFIGNQKKKEVRREEGHGVGGRRKNEEGNEEWKKVIQERWGSKNINLGKKCI